MAKTRIKRGARLRDVAAAAGVSRTTASAVVNGKAEAYGICSATRAKVESAIRQLGYVPSQAALDMVAGRNSLVGLAISGDKVMADRLIAIFEPALANAGFRLIVAILPPDPQASITRLASLDRFNLAGLAIWPTGDLSIPKLSCPAIVIGKPDTSLPSVYDDEAEGGRQLAGRLLDKGHRTIAIIGTTTPVVSGCLEACAKSGASTRVFSSVAELLGAPLSATAVFCATPQALLELYSRCPGTGIRLGLDLAVVGTDAFGMAASLTPPPTVLHPGLARLGQVAAQLLQQAIQGTASGDIRLVPVIADGDSICMPPAPKQPSESIQIPKPAAPGIAAPPPQASPTPPPQAAPIRPSAPPVAPQPSRPPITPLPVPVRPPAPVTPPPVPAPEVHVTVPVVPATAQRPADPASETPASQEPITEVPTVQPPPPIDFTPPQQETQSPVSNPTTPEATEATQAPEPPSESIQIPESAVPPPAEPPPEVTPEPEPVVTSEPPPEQSPQPEPEPVAPPVVEPPPAQVVVQQPPAEPEPVAAPESAPEGITVTPEVPLETQPVSNPEPDIPATEALPDPSREDKPSSGS